MSFEQQVIKLLNENKLTFKQYKGYSFPILKAFFGQYYYYLIIWDKKDNNIKNLYDLERARLVFYKNENVNEKILSVLVYKLDFGIKIDDIIEKWKEKKTSLELNSFMKMIRK
ncbi:23017_t:CDS:1 [Gigaspora margarita]|uniref:23017_t:CDS:1 n=1 Tax=Gigaspora margarita TaxID=4874 RepID=A0ABN7X9J6_GIGMA|nr:23017_t:CDS:1 [Gigaspora margarita]